MLGVLSLMGLTDCRRNSNLEFELNPESGISSGISLCTLRAIAGQDQVFAFAIAVQQVIGGKADLDSERHLF